MTEMMRMLYAYNAWANQRILDKAADLTAEQLHAKAGASFDSVHDTLVHTMSAQWVWFMRWMGTSPTSMLKPADYPTLETMEARWREIEADTQAFLAQLDESGLQRVVRYNNIQGKAFAYPLWQLLLHQVNHGTQHRSEVAMILTQHGRSPGNMDLSVYLTGLLPPA
jgi:uncharacterized damage-inducible protein DinB